MGGNNSKPSSATTKNKEAHQGTGQPARKIRRNEEGFMMKDINGFNRAKLSGALSKRQNQLPSMTQRVLKQESVVLCRTPLLSPSHKDTTFFSSSRVLQSMVQEAYTEKVFSPLATEIDTRMLQRSRLKTRGIELFDSELKESIIAVNSKHRQPSRQKHKQNSVYEERKPKTQQVPATRAKRNSEKSIVKTVPVNLLGSYSAQASPMFQQSDIPFSLINSSTVIKSNFQSPNKKEEKSGFRKKGSIERNVYKSYLHSSKIPKKTNQSSYFIKDRAFQTSSFPYHRNDSSYTRLDTHESMDLERRSVNLQREASIKQLKRNHLGALIQENNQIIEIDYNSLVVKNIRAYRSFDFCSQILMTLLQFNMDEYPKYLLLSPTWHFKVTEAMDEYVNKLENDFAILYSEFLLFHQSYTSVQTMNFCGTKGLRLDRVFHCEVILSPRTIGKTFNVSNTVSYKHQVTRMARKILYQSQHRFDITKPTSRCTWIHMSDDNPTYCQNEVQMSPGDRIEFAVPIFNMNGLVDLDSFEWKPPEILTTPKETPFNYNKDIAILKKNDRGKSKVYCDINRICEVEDAVVEWIPVGTGRDQPRIPIPLAEFQTRFEVLSVHYNALDQQYQKIVLKTKRRGLVESEIFGRDIQIDVKWATQSVVNEIQKRGMVSDKKQKIQMRVGDLLVVYASRSLHHLENASNPTMQSVQSENDKLLKIYQL